MTADVTFGGLKSCATDNVYFCRPLFISLVLGIQNKNERRNKKYLIDERRKLKEIHQSTKYAENLSNTTNFKPLALITKKLYAFQNDILGK